MGLDKLIAVGWFFAYWAGTFLGLMAMFFACILAIKFFSDAEFKNQDKEVMTDKEKEALSEIIFGACFFALVVAALFSSGFWK